MANVKSLSNIRLSLFQEEERKKREELEAILAENNRKIEEAQKKLVSGPG